MQLLIFFWNVLKRYRFVFSWDFWMNIRRTWRQTFVFYRKGYIMLTNGEGDKKISSIFFVTGDLNISIGDGVYSGEEVDSLVEAHLKEQTEVFTRVSQLPFVLLQSLITLIPLVVLLIRLF